MSKVLTSFSGQYGDALWSLPTIKLISQMAGEPVDFAIMDQYKGVLPVFQAQPYIAKAFAVKEWIQVHNNHGAQPWNPPSFVEEGYERCWHLGYRGHPGLNDDALPLIDYIAHKQGLKLKNPVPFIEVVGSDPAAAFDTPKHLSTRIAYACNDAEGYQKNYETFLTALRSKINESFCFVDVGKFSWLDAAAIIKNSIAFVGCRSANYVLAHGVGQKIITFEPHPARHANGFLGMIFGCPYGEEHPLPFNMSEEMQAEVAAQYLIEWRRNRDEAVAISYSAL